MVAILNAVKAHTPSDSEPARACHRPRVAGSSRQRWSASATRVISHHDGAVASDAGVAVQTVYFTFHTKAELLIAAVRVAGGAPGDPEVQSSARGSVGPRCAHGRRRLALIVEHGNEIYARVAPLMLAVRAAAIRRP